MDSKEVKSDTFFEVKCKQTGEIVAAYSDERSANLFKKCLGVCYEILAKTTTHKTTLKTTTQSDDSYSRETPLQSEVHQEAHQLLVDTHSA